MSERRDPDRDRGAAVPGIDAGPRPGEHPEAVRSGTSRWTAYGLAGLLIVAGLIFVANWFGMLGGT